MQKLAVLIDTIGKHCKIENILHFRPNLGYTPNDINSMLSRSQDILLICHHRKPCIDDIFFYSTIAEPLYCTKYDRLIYYLVFGLV